MRGVVRGVVCGVERGVVCGEGCGVDVVNDVVLIVEHGGVRGVAHDE